MNTKINMIGIVGPTATGKTELATRLAHHINGEIISADSRQLYRGMDIGTGKDLKDYTIDGEKIPYHLIDICDAGYQYNLYEYQRDFLKAFDLVQSHNRLPILCGGTGLYVESVLKGYKLIEVPTNEALRSQLENKSLEELTEILKTYPNHKLHNKTDVDTIKRAIRSIEITDYYSKHDVENTPYPTINPIIFGVQIDRELRRQKITRRLKARLEEGMIDEVQGLLDSGIPAENLIYYGLEYKFVTNYILGNISYEELFTRLEIAIHQFAKRQMTWYRGMERRGTPIHWIEATLPMETKIQQILDIYQQHK